MIIKKKSNIEGGWAKAGQDLVNGTTIEIQDAGQEMEGEYGPRMVFKVLTRNGEKNMSFNRTTLNNLVDAFGENTEEWINQQARVHVIKVMVSGKMRDVVYLSGLEWDMLDDGSFQKRKGAKAVSSTNEDIPVISF